MTLQILGLALFLGLFLFTYRRATATRQAVGDAEAAFYNGGTIQIRTGAQPATPDTAAAGTLLGTLTFNATAFGSTNSSGVATANAITSDTSADNSGTAAHARLLNSSAAIRSDCSCGQGTGDISFDNSVIVAGGVIAISSMTLTTPQ
jgi:hypothetical protein